MVALFVSLDVSLSCPWNFVTFLFIFVSCFLATQGDFFLYFSRRFSLSDVLMDPSFYRFLLYPRSSLPIGFPEPQPDAKLFSFRLGWFGEEVREAPCPGLVFPFFIFFFRPP